MHAPLTGIALLVVATATGSGCVSAPRHSPDHEALVAAERVFARHAETADVRTAFLAAFAEDGIWMTPAPLHLRDAYARRPAPADPRAVRLEWEPVASGIASSGDFGFTSGPSTLSLRDGSQPPRHGAYFSVWKRDAQQGWRVALDAGITSPVPIAADALLPSPRVAAAGRAGTGHRDALFAIERGSSADAAAYDHALAADARLYRSGPPVFGAGAIRSELAANLPLALEPLGGDVATSGDLAYTYGAWRGQRANGHYVHLWTRDVGGAWKIALAISLDGG